MGMVFSWVFLLGKQYLDVSIFTSRPTAQLIASTYDKLVHFSHSFTRLTNDRHSLLAKQVSFLSILRYLRFDEGQVILLFDGNSTAWRDGQEGEQDQKRAVVVATSDGSSGHIVPPSIFCSAP